MKPEDFLPLHFEFVPSADERKRADGFGSGILYLDGRPFWYGGESSNPSFFEWTWVDLLEHLARTWSALILEQTYPFQWLAKAVEYPAEIWSVADKRWSYIGDEVAELEEPRLYAFVNRHNLAAAWKGISVPALYWLRVGDSVWLSPEDGKPIRANFQECLNALIKLGNSLAAAFEGSNNRRVAQALQNWKERDSVMSDVFFEFMTGLTRESLLTIENGVDRAKFWEVSEISGWCDLSANDNEFLAAARMTSGILSPECIESLMERIRALPKVDTPELDNLSFLASAVLLQHDRTLAHEDGYLLAAWLRQQLGMIPEMPFRIDEFLRKHGVIITDAAFGTDHIEAMACWGRRGPAILLNDDRAFGDSTERRNMTLAHELCHLLVDRHTSLPAAEVLGGNIDLYVEKRAFAFGAELLLPRVAVQDAYFGGHSQLSTLTRYLRAEYGVSKTVVYAQVHNSSVFDNLSLKDRIIVEGRIHGYRDRTILAVSRV